VEMATSTPPSPPHAAAGSRRPFFIRWWYDPVTAPARDYATVLALLYAAGGLRLVDARLLGRPLPQHHATAAGNEPPCAAQTSKVYAADGRLISELGIELAHGPALDQIPCTCARRSSPSRTSGLQAQRHRLLAHPRPLQGQHPDAALHAGFRHTMPARNVLSPSAWREKKRRRICARPGGRGAERPRMRQ